MRSTAAVISIRYEVEVTFPPFLEDVGDRPRVEAVNRLQEIVGLGDKLHVRIFDAVMHHLDVVAGPLRPDMGDARRVIDLRRHLAHDGLDAPVGVELAAGHHARAVQRPLLAPGDAHADEADAGVLEFGEAAVGVRVERVAAVDQDVARLEMRQKLGDHVVDRLSGLDHDDEGARPGDRGDELRQASSPGRNGPRRRLPHQLVGAAGMAIVDRDPEAFSRGVAGEIRTHRRRGRPRRYLQAPPRVTSSSRHAARARKASGPFAAPLAIAQSGRLGHRVDTPRVRP